MLLTTANHECKYNCIDNIIVCYVIDIFSLLQNYTYYITNIYFKIYKISIEIYIENAFFEIEHTSLIVTSYRRPNGHIL